MDGLVAANLPRHLPDHVEQTRVHMNFFVLAPVANEPVKPFQRLVVIAVVAFVGDRNVFVGVNVMSESVRVSALATAFSSPLLPSNISKAASPVHCPVREDKAAVNSWRA